MKALEGSSSLYIWLTLTENSKNSKHFLQKHKLYIELSIGRWDVLDLNADYPSYGQFVWINGNQVSACIILT